MNNMEYKKYTTAHAKKSSFPKNFLLAFICGGAICLVGQILNDLYTAIEINEKVIKMLVPVSLVFFSCLTTGIGIFDVLAKHCGAGTLVPITGFANAVMSPAMEYKTEGYVFGTAAKMFTIAGPVIVYGTLTSAVYGVILFIVETFIK